MHLDQVVGGCFVGLDPESKRVVAILALGRCRIGGEAENSEEIFGIFNLRVEIWQRQLAGVC